MNIKKLFPENKMSKKKVVEFLDKKGFYIVLVVCIGIIAAATIYVTTKNVMSPDSDFDAQNIISDESKGIAASNPADKPVVQSSVNNVQGTTTAKDTADKTTSAAAGTTAVQQSGNKAAGTTTNQQAASKTTTASATDNVKFAVPVFGGITLEYAVDKLTYSKTLEEWRAHPGVDIAAEKNTAVKAVADGIVCDIKNDPRFGAIVIIDHQNGLKSLYANLATGDVVSVNQKVKQGDLIGSVGNTATIESAEQSHLHFEVFKNGKNVDPTVYLPKK